LTEVSQDLGEDAKTLAVVFRGKGTSEEAGDPERLIVTDVVWYTPNRKRPDDLSK
jgi:hypothetical protein